MFPYVDGPDDIETCKVGYYNISFSPSGNITPNELLDADSVPNMLRVQNVTSMTHGLNNYSTIINNLDEEIIDDEIYIFYYYDCINQLYINIYDENNDNYHGKLYKAPHGMTWGEWLDSEYNTDNIHFEDGANIGCGKMQLIVRGYNYSHIVSYDEIINPYNDYYLDIVVCGD